MTGPLVEKISWKRTQRTNFVPISATPNELCSTAHANWKATIPVFDTCAWQPASVPEGRNVYRKPVPKKRKAPEGRNVEATEHLAPLGLRAV